MIARYPQTSSRQGQSGFTVIELMITVMVMAILASLVGPAFAEFFDKQRLKGAVEDIQGMVAEAKSEAIVRGTDTFVDIEALSSWCVGYTTKASCDCTQDSGADLCSVDMYVSGASVAITQRLLATEYTDVTLAHNFASGLGFDAVNSLTTAGTVTLTSGQWTAKVVVSRLGRSRVCVDDDLNVGLGYAKC